MRIESVGPDLEIAIGATYESNATIFYSGEEVLLVDAMGSREDAAALADHLDGHVVRFIVSTHYFSDHMAGLALFPGALVIAHRNFPHTFEGELYRSDEEARFFVAPSIVINDEMRIRWGRHTLEIFHNAGHTMSTLNIDVPEADLVFTADNVVGNIVYLAYSCPDLIGESLRDLKRRGRSRLISSHGGVSARERLDHAIDYLERLETRVSVAWKDGVDAVCAIGLDACLPDNVNATEFENVFHKRNLDVICDRKLFHSSGGGSHEQ